METDVVVTDQHDQLCVGGVSEHPVEAADVVLPVLRRHNNTGEAGFALLGNSVHWEAAER